MLRASLILAFTVTACLAQSDANQGLNQYLKDPFHLLKPSDANQGLNQYLKDPFHLLKPLQPRAPALQGTELRLTVPLRMAFRMRPPCMRISPQELLPVDPKVDPKIFASAPGAGIDQKILIHPAPACPEP